MTLRPELRNLPERMKALPVDRGYPVPWFVEWVENADGSTVPEFRAMSLEKWIAAVNKRLCWVCGQRLGANLAFVIGPMCGITRTTSEPACHLECAIWSAQNCPFLTRPDMTRRPLENDYDNVSQPAGYHIDRNPGAILVWVARNYEVFSDGMGGYLIKMGDPQSISAWREGRTATPEEVDYSISTGLPALYAKTENDEDVRDLDGLVKDFRSVLGL